MVSRYASAGPDEVLLTRPSAANHCLPLGPVSLSACSTPGLSLRTEFSIGKIQVMGTAIVDPIGSKFRWGHVQPSPRPFGGSAVAVPRPLIPIVQRRH